MKKPKLLTDIIVLFFFTAWWSTEVCAGADLDYKDRGNRYEGIKSKPISAQNIELLAFQVHYTDKARLKRDTYLR